MVNLETILFPKISDKKITLVLIITIAFLLIDTMINNVSDFLVPQSTSKWGVIFFVMLAIVFAISQYLLLRFVWWKTKNIRSNSLLINGLLKVVFASQYTLLAILII